LLTRPERSNEPRCEMDGPISANWRRSLASAVAWSRASPSARRDRRWEGLSGACNSAPLATCQALPCHDLGGASRGRTGSQGSPVRGARSAGRRPDLDGPSARATIAPGRGRGASSRARRLTTPRTELLEAAVGQHRILGLPARHPGAPMRISVKGRLCRAFVAQVAKMSEVVRGRPARCPEMRLTCSGWGHRARDGADGRPIQDVELTQRRRGLIPDEEMTAGPASRIAARHRLEWSHSFLLHPLDRAVVDAYDCGGLATVAPPHNSVPHPAGDPNSGPDNLPHLEPSALSAWSVCRWIGRQTGTGGVPC
jgi:hypothetical protein